MAVEGWMMSDGIVIASAVLDEGSTASVTMIRRCLAEQVAVVGKPRLVLVALAVTQPAEVALLDEDSTVTRVLTLRPWRATVVARASTVVVAPAGVLERASVAVGHSLAFKGAP